MTFRNGLSRSQYAELFELMDERYIHDEPHIVFLDVDPHSHPRLAELMVMMMAVTEDWEETFSPDLSSTARVAMLEEE